MHAMHGCAGQRGHPREPRGGAGGAVRACGRHGAFFEMLRCCAFGERMHGGGFCETGPARPAALSSSSTPLLPSFPPPPRPCCSQVEVGANLLKIDTAGTPSVASPAPTQAAQEPAAPASGAATPAPADADHGHGHGQRKPLIKFLGKRVLLPKASGAGAGAAAGGGAFVAAGGAAAGSLSSPVRYEDVKGTPGAKMFDELPPMFGRPALSPQEMAAVESGGAD